MPPVTLKPPLPPPPPTLCAKIAPESSPLVSIPPTLNDEHRSAGPAGGARAAQADADRCAGRDAAGDAEAAVAAAAADALREQTDSVLAVGLEHAAVLLAV